MSNPKTYHVYRFDGRRMALTDELIDADSDEQAIAQAQAADCGSKCEIWDGQRLVASFGGERQSA